MKSPSGGVPRRKDESGQQDGSPGQPEGAGLRVTGIRRADPLLLEGSHDGKRGRSDCVSGRWRVQKDREREEEAGVPVEIQGLQPLVVLLDAGTEDG